MSGVAPVAAALLNWNGWRDTIECLTALAQVQYPGLDLYLCDNASSDDSVPRIVAWARQAGWEPLCVPHRGDGEEARAFAGRAGPPRLTVIQNPTNDGFARGTNVAIRYALASGRRYSYLWALNTDTIAEPDAVATAVAVLEAAPAAGSAQSLLLGHPNDRLVDSAGIRLLARGGARDLLHGRAPSLVPGAGGRAGPPVPIFGCCAASAFYRVSALAQIGLFDEGLFQTNEDVDLACRLRAAGWTAYLVPASVVRHKGGVSRRRKGGRMWFIAHRAKLAVVMRWWPRTIAIPVGLVGALRALQVVFRSRDVTIAAWWDLVRRMWRELRDGASGAIRRRVLNLGRRGFIS